MAKTYYEQRNIGRCNYVINFHDGNKTYGDGSPFYDVRIFSNQKVMRAFVRRLVAEGYRAE